MAKDYPNVYDVKTDTKQNANETIKLNDGRTLVKNPNGQWVSTDNPDLKVSYNPNPPPVTGAGMNLPPGTIEALQSEELKERIATKIPFISAQYKKDKKIVDVAADQDAIDDSAAMTEKKDTRHPEGYAIGRRATPVGVLSQFSQGYVESLMVMPDWVVQQVAQGISDTFDLGWKDEEIFQFVDMINKGKVGYMGGSLYMWENPDQKAKRLGLTMAELENIDMPQNEWEKWARTTGHIAGFGSSVFLPSSLAAVRGWPGSRKLVAVRGPGGSTRWEWQVDPSKIQSGFKGSVKAGVQDYMNWIANNPLKAAQMDLMFSIGGGTGLYGVQRSLTDEFKKEHPVLTNLAEMGGIMVGAFPAPAIAIGVGNLGYIMVTKAPGGLVIKYGGQLVNKLLSLKTKTQQQQFMRSIEKQVDKKIVEQLKEQFHIARQDPASVLPRETAILIKSNVVHGDAINALKQSMRDEGMEEEAIMETLWAMAVNNPDPTKPVEILGKTFDVGTLGAEALIAYEKSLRAQGLSDDAIMKALDAARLKLSIAEIAPSATMKQSQLSMENRASGERLGQIINRKQSNIDKVASFYEAMFTTDKDAPTYIVDHLTGNILKVNQFKEEIEATGTALQTLAGETLPTITQADKIATGKNLRTTLVELLNDAKQPYRDTTEIIQTVGKNTPIHNFQTLKDDILEGIWGVTREETTFEKEVLKTRENLPDVIKNLLTFEGTPSIYDMWKLYMGFL